ncbi:MAG: SGNH/GDSL hydrolase family protein [Flavobacterium sp.]|nr:MAG: SGNH/GDSL hydrolase family protein [Flavobacterium sp.]
MKAFQNIYYLFFVIVFASCSGNDDRGLIANNPIQNPIVEDSIPENPQEENPETYAFKYLALGDSYTIGQNVCDTCRFPYQLKESLEAEFNSGIELKIIAQTGWTTTNLKNAISTQSPTTDYDLVTLLIGVNNQYQNKPFSLYEQEFPELLTTAIALAKGEKNNVIVVSIPDYAFTPYGNGSTTISTQIDAYNAFAENYATQNGVVFVNITDITRQGLANPALVASDGLHPSQLAYSKFVERILPKAILVLEN